MMISPESYSEQFLKDKNAEEILKIIEDLKGELNRLTKSKKNQYINNKSSKVFSCTRQYLDKAFEALNEVGGTYVPSKEEQEYLSYVENIADISKIIFTTGGFFEGYKTYIYSVLGNKVYVKTMKAYAEEDLTNLGVEAQITKQKLLDGIKKLHIFEWQEHYYANVLDGCQWEIEIEFSNGYKPFKSDGSNAYPYNYRDMLELLGIKFRS